MRILTDPPAGYICLGKQFCWPVYGWRPNRFQQVVWAVCLGVTWRPHV